MAAFESRKGLSQRSSRGCPLRYYALLIN